MPLDRVKNMNFQTEDIPLKIAHLGIKLTVITNLDELFDAHLQKDDDHADVQDERIPYWAELWASAIGMSEYLIENQLITPDKKVLEIGCGLGLPSIVAGLLGAKNVTLSDYFQAALDFAEMNWLKNLPLQKAKFLKMDWRNIPPSVETDILLASDVAYEKRAFEPLLKAFKKLLTPHGTILISEPNRYISKAFFSNLHKEGYNVKHIEKYVERKGHTFLINLYEVKKLF
jgi:predicted nicotinamide N-methyase